MTPRHCVDDDRVDGVGNHRPYPRHSTVDDAAVAATADERCAVVVVEGPRRKDRHRDRVRP